MIKFRGTDVLLCYHFYHENFNCSKYLNITSLSQLDLGMALPIVKVLVYTVNLGILKDIVKIRII